MEEHDFDVLSRWSRLSDPELMMLNSMENRAVLNRIVRELDDRGVLVKDDDAAFRDLVRVMRKRYEEGSRGLGDAIVAAGECRDNGRDAEANEILEAFAQQCPAPFYRRIALNYRR